MFRDKKIDFLDKFPPKSPIHLSKIELSGRHAKVSGVIPGLCHEHAIGTQSDAITDDDALQDHTGNPQQVIVTNGDSAREVRPRHEAVEIAYHIIMAHDHMVINEVEATERHVTGNHAVVLDNIAIPHLECPLIDDKQ